MNNKAILILILIGLMFIFLLPACKRSELEGVTPTSSIIEAKATETEHPVPDVTEETSFPTITLSADSQPSDTYPEPVISPTRGSVAESGESVYPPPADPGVSLTAQAGQELPYPGAATFPPTVTPVIDAGYPGPGNEMISTPTLISSPYPAPGTSIPTQTQVLSPSPSANVPTQPALIRTPTPAVGPPTSTSVSSGSPTPFPALTPTLVRASFVMSNPADFRLISGKPQLIVFYAEWSPTSKSMAPVVNGLADRYSDRIGFFFIDIDEPANSLFNTLISNRLVPIFILLDRQGNVLNEWQGIVEVESFEKEFNKLAP